MTKKMMNMMALSALFALTVTGCSTADTVDTGTVPTTSAQTAAETAAETTGASSRTHETITFDIPSDDSEKKADAQDTQTETQKNSNLVTASYQANADGKIDTTDLFSKRDLEQSADLTDASTLTASDSETLNITAAGVYVLSGSAQNCTVVVNAAKEDKVQIVLDNVSITNSDFPVIYVVSADKVFVTSTGTNTLSVTGSFRADGDTNTDAVIYSKDDLVLNGTGNLSITSASGNGITVKDDLKVTGGIYTVTTALDAFEANDSISICGGSFTVQSNKDGFHCENDSAEGTIYIADGSFTIQADSDGIQATSVLQIDGGSFDITSSEGMEATYVQINGGTISITASDDGINATNKCNGAYPVVVEFNDGDITISMGQGDTDAVDANGSIYVNGGTIHITAPTSSFDYDQSAEYNGGTIIINGEQVSEIPQSMMGGPGGFGGGFQPGQNGGQQGGFDGRHGDRSNGNMM